ncbi:hypothetical protein PsorP6_013006 [Peronosclerospora sorghi]|uniref:Uncharacterized protein n=1 Tax=Peronosclerospora sorghi TaxID=230839 RepID=A0ACC0WH90_9STRA|nr:hypothetical protein PsorP6_013006 [Peronosclerospora sorghi]
MNALLTQNLESAEAALLTKDTELEALKQEFDLLKAQLADEQAKALEAILAVEKLQEAVATDAAEARSKLIKSHQSLNWQLLRRKADGTINAREQQVAWFER